MREIPTGAEEAVEYLWRQGCPVAAPAGRAALISVAFRRWSTQRRRLRPRQLLDRQDRVQDLTIGIRDAMEPDRGLVGPLVVDYQCVAEVLLDVFEAGTPPGPRPADPEAPPEYRCPG